MPDRPFSIVFGTGIQKEQLEQQKRHEQTAALSQLLDDPYVNIDAKNAIANHLVDLMNVPTKHKGLISSLVGLFHHQSQPSPQQPKPPTEYYGNRDERLPTGKTVGLAPGETVETDMGTMDSSTAPAMALTQRRGSMTTTDLKNRDALEMFTQQQKIKAGYDAENDARTEARQLKAVQLRNEGALQRLQVGLEGKMDLLDQGEQLRAHRDVAKLIDAGYTPELAATTIQQQIQTDLSVKRARHDLLVEQTKAIPTRLAQGWQKLENDAIRTEVYRTMAGNTTAKTAFDETTKPLFAELSMVRRQIEYFSKFDTAATTFFGNPKYPVQAEGLKQAKESEAAILKLIEQAGTANAPQQPSASTVPSRPGRGARIAPKVSPGNLNKVMGLP